MNESSTFPAAASISKPSLRSRSACFSAAERTEAADLAGETERPAGTGVLKEAAAEAATVGRLLGAAGFFFPPPTGSEPDDSLPERMEAESLPSSSWSPSSEEATVRLRFLPEVKLPFAFALPFLGFVAVSSSSSSS